ncbi:major capsid family protein [Xenorhabdus ishibashii]|uniref:Phage protein n=1 Tax=Xenorhabdus ishibashii TaxID=1034471 RepID=A0A2D0KD07_9GAMM|nr:major capsid family protein [Xenorhabdus ishibashii]PHM61195.1 phage protein [Xenorhabdus ishibashii]
MSKLSFEQAKKYGFVFNGAREWITRDNMPRLIQDAALITSPNSTIPAELLAYVDPTIIEILTAPRNAREVFSEEKRGDWTTPYMKWRANEVTGNTAAYSDFGHSGKSGTNYEWHVREQYRYQTIIQYGDLEADMASEAKINLAADKQRAAATIIDIDSNKFYLLGVAGREIYGALNDPNLTPAIVAAPSGEKSSIKWIDKNTRQRYNDVLNLFARLVNQTQGLVSERDRLILTISPTLRVQLGDATDFNVSVMKMLTTYFSNLEIVSLPQLGGVSGETMQLIAPKVAGMETGLLGFGEKMRAGRIVPEISSFSQKFTATTYGAVIRIPAAIAQMTGM